jgi:hypothetical protein
MQGLKGEDPHPQSLSKNYPFYKTPRTLVGREFLREGQFPREGERLKRKPQRRYKGQTEP